MTKYIITTDKTLINVSLVRRMGCSEYGISYDFEQSPLTCYLVKCGKHTADLIFAKLVEFLQDDKMSVFDVGELYNKLTNYKK